MEDKRRKSIAPYARPLNLRMLTALSKLSWIFPFYHSVNCTTPSHLRHLYKIRSEKEFDEDMEYMLRYFEPASLEDYLGGKKGGKKRMLLSFDDGMIECHQFIAPYLKKKGVPAIFFLNNDFIDNRGLFYRYRASMLIDHMATDKCHVTRAAEFLSIPEEKVQDAILMISARQAPLLDSLAMIMEFDEAVKLRENPVYMSSEQVRDLQTWGFHIGGHGTDHAEFREMEAKTMALNVGKSIDGLRRKFSTPRACFAFPFTSDGVPAAVIDQVLEEGVADVLFGTAGLKDTGRERFIQRIPMERLDYPAERVLKTEFLYYLMKAPLGRNRYFHHGE